MTILPFPCKQSSFFKKHANILLEMWPSHNACKYFFKPKAPCSTFRETQSICKNFTPPDQTISTDQFMGIEDIFCLFFFQKEVGCLSRFLLLFPSLHAAMFSLQKYKKTLNIGQDSDDYIFKNVFSHEC